MISNELSEGKHILAHTVIHIFLKFLLICLVIQKFAVNLHSLNERGTIAQLVEQRTENPCVPGSIPGGTTINPDYLMIVRIFFIENQCVPVPKLRDNLLVVPQIILII